MLRRDRAATRAWRGLAGLAGLAMLAVFAVASPAAASHSSAPFLLGVSTEGGDLARSLTALDRFGGRRQAVVGTWLAKFGPGFRQAVPDTIHGSLTTIWDRGYVPMLTWLVPMQDQILAGGGYDSYLRTVAAQLKAWLAGPDGRFGTGEDRRLYLRPSPEANRDGCSYCAVGSGSGRITDVAYSRNVHTFKKSWVRLYGLLRNAGLDSRHLQVVFAVNDVDAYRSRARNDWRPEPVTEDLYPGTSYVDWVGVDGYARGQSPGRLFDPMLARLERLTGGQRPVGVTEWGAYPNVSLRQKNEYLTAFFAWLQHRPVRMALYWNAPDYEGSPAVEVLGNQSGCDRTFRVGDWSVRACSGYRTGARAASGALSARRSAPRRISDRAFTTGR